MGETNSAAVDDLLLKNFFAEVSEVERDNEVARSLSLSLSINLAMYMCICVCALLFELLFAGWEGIRVFLSAI